MPNPRPQAVVFEEPEQCLECESDNPMTFQAVSMDNKDGHSAWVCDDCGHAHLNPDHVEDECVGC